MTNDERDKAAEELKPCPWCGRQPTLLLDNQPGVPEWRLWRIECKVCDVIGPASSTPQAADRLWNNRKSACAESLLKWASENKRCSCCKEIGCPGLESDMSFGEEGKDSWMVFLSDLEAFLGKKEGA